MEFKLWLEATSTYTKRIKDPALLTFEEFYKLINSQFKSHSEGAYDWDLSQMKGKKVDFPQLVFTKTINNISFEFRVNKKDRYKGEKFVKFDDKNNPLKINGELQYYNLEELGRMGIRRWDFGYSAFHGEQQVAVSQDEWGCLLVVVAREYRGFGLGPIITKMAWESEPGKDSGGCTAMGSQMVRKVHGEFVKEYLQKGFYSHLVSQGVLTSERAKQIIASALLTNTTKKESDYNTDNPENWLLFGGQGIFIIYDKKLKDLADIDEDKDYWRERAIKGVADIGPHYTNKNYRLRVFGGESDSIKKFLMFLAVSWASESNELLRVNKEHLPFVDTSNIELDGEWAKTNKLLNYKPMINAEKKFRKEFDKYGEFHDRLIELAVSKYD